MNQKRHYSGAYGYMLQIYYYSTNYSTKLITLYHTLLCCTLLYYTILFDDTLYVLYYTLPCCLLHSTRLNYTLQYNTTP